MMNRRNFLGLSGLAATVAVIGRKQPKGYIGKFKPESVEYSQIIPVNSTIGLITGSAIINTRNNLVARIDSILRKKRIHISSMGSSLFKAETGDTLLIVSPAYPEYKPAKLQRNPDGFTYKPLAAQIRVM